MIAAELILQCYRVQATSDSYAVTDLMQNSWLLCEIANLIGCALLGSKGFPVSSSWPEKAHACQPSSPSWHRCE